MKLIRDKGILILVWCVVAIAVIVLMRAYFVFVSDHIYKDNSKQLSEVYAQVDKNFAAFLSQGWRNLEDWDDLVRVDNESRVRSLLEDRKEIWGFTDFIFISSNDTYITSNGEYGAMQQTDDLDSLFNEHRNIMSGQLLPDGVHFTVLAIPVEQGVFNDFEYDAIAITYSNADMSESLDTRAFNNESTCFVLKPDGKVVLSTQEGGTVFDNYLTYLERGSDLTADQIDQIKQNMVNQISDVIVCDIGGKSHYLSYSPIGYEDYILLGVVPESAVSASLVEVQKVTLDVAIKVALLVFIALVFQIVFSFRKKARQNALELKYRDFMFSLLSDSVDDISIMVDGNTWKPDYISNNIERLLGVTVKEAMDDLRVLDKCNLDNNAGIEKQVLLDIPIGGSITREQEHINIATGQRRSYRETIYHEVMDGKDKYFVLLSDRTEERKMNRNLKEALETAKSANRAKSAFLSNMSHDIRTPMNAIMGFTELLNLNVNNPEKINEYVEKISSSGEHLLGLINDVLDMSKIESGKTSINNEPFKMNEIIDGVCTIVIPQAEAKNQTFTLIRDESFNETLIGDRLRINQILLNLLSNAIKYTPENGNLKFEIEKLPASAGFSQPVRFVVSDDGIGMSPEYLETIFDPFTREISSTTNTVQGTGLGMAITKNIIDLMGGTIRVDSEVGKGTTFTVELSFELGSDAVVSQVGTSEQAVNEDALEGLKILIAEDNEMGAMMLTERLEIEGATVTRAHDGIEAVDIFKNSAPGQFDLILMDVEMPNMNGYDATRNIRVADHIDAIGIPIFAMTANVFAEDVKEALESGMNVHLAKPVDMEKLKLNVEKYVQK